MQEAGISVRPEYTVKSTTEVTGGYTSTMDLLRLDQPPTAICSLNNRMALGVIRESTGSVSESDSHRECNSITRRGTHRTSCREDE